MHICLIVFSGLWILRGLAVVLLGSLYWIKRSV